MVPSVSLILAGAAGGWLLLGGLMDETMRNPAKDGAQTPAMERTGAIPVALNAAPNRLEIFREGVSAILSEDMDTAISARNKLRRGDIHRDTLTYLIVNSESYDIPATEFEGARRELAGWPEIEAARMAFERALYRENPSIARIEAAFASSQPTTSEGKILQARAFRAGGDEDQAHDVIMPLWAGDVLTRWQEGEVLKYFGDLLKPSDHRKRMEYLLYRDRINQAARFATLGEAKPLFDAWSAVIRGKANAEKLLKAAEADFKDTSALKFARILYLQKRDMFAEAAHLIETSQEAEKTATSPGEWWDERRIVSRGLYEAREFKNAYALVAAHHAQTPQDRADAEFHAGWYALRGLNDSLLAATHFEKLLDISTLPSTRSRALYWLGRAQEKDNPQLARTHMGEAASYGGNFYGQLAASRLKRPITTAAAPQLPALAQRAFDEMPPVKAINLLETNGYHQQARRIYEALAAQTDSASLLTMLHSRAEARQDSALALSIGKTAYYRGLAPFSAAFPDAAITPGLGLSAEERALSLAIARQESGFNGAAVSPVNARGLMQVMPATAKEISTRLGLAYAPEKLTSDDAYNALLGSHYAAEQIRKHKGSYILTFAAYNAGPGRVKEWLARFGDPRGKSTDEVVDWIEMIPFPETRAYVQRVMENFEVYKMRFGLPADIASDISAIN